MSARHAGVVGQEGVETAKSSGPLIARGLLLLGRALVVLAPASVVVTRLTRSAWASAAVDSGGLPNHPVIHLFMVFAFVFAFAFPLLLLPIGSVWLVSVTGGVMTVPTVLGVRQVNADSSRVSAAWLPGRGWSSWLYLLRDEAGRRLVVAHSSIRALPAEFRSALIAGGAGHPRLSDAAQLALDTQRPVPWRRRCATYAMGWLLLVAWSVIAVVVLVGMLALSGALPDA